MIAFDLDGTLVDSLAGIYASLQAACAAQHLQAPRMDQVRRSIGPPLRQYLPELLQIPAERAEVTMEPLLQHFRRHHDREGWRQYRLYPGVPELLQRLHRAGWSLHVVTHKPWTLAEQLLLQEGFDGLFGSLHAPGSPHWQSKADALKTLRQQEAWQHWYVGDTTSDQQAAREAGHRFVAAGYGYGHCPHAEARITAPLELLEVPGLLRDSGRGLG